MSWTDKQRITLAAILLLVAAVPILWQIDDVRASQAIEKQQTDLIARTVTPSDYDSDGIVDATDVCPTRPETNNGFQDLDGCPDIVKTVQASDANKTPPMNQTAVATQTPRPTVADYDGDGIPDSADRCPTRPENRNGFEDSDGCPDVVATTGAS